MYVRRRCLGSGSINFRVAGAHNPGSSRQTLSAASCTLGPAPSHQQTGWPVGLACDRGLSCAPTRNRCWSSCLFGPSEAHERPRPVASSK